MTTTFPKWVIPHPSRVRRDIFHNLGVIGFDDFYYDRNTDIVTVYVKDAATEALALSPAEEPAAHSRWRK